MPQAGQRQDDGVKFERTQRKDRQGNKTNLQQFCILGKFDYRGGHGEKELGRGTYVVTAIVRKYDR